MVLLIDDESGLEFEYTLKHSSVFVLTHSKETDTIRSIVEAEFNLPAEIWTVELLINRGH